MSLNLIDPDWWGLEPPRCKKLSRKDLDNLGKVKIVGPSQVKYGRLSLNDGIVERVDYYVLGWIKEGYVVRDEQAKASSK